MYSYINLNCYELHQPLWTTDNGTMPLKFKQLDKINDYPFQRMK